MLSRAELDQMRCPQRSCDHDHSVLYLRAVCHPEAGLQVSYIKRRGVIVVQCGVCKSVAAELQVSRVVESQN